jgi:hypothetical protein
MDELWLEQILGFLEVPSKQRERFRVLAYRWYEEEGEIPKAELYNRVVRLLEERNIPFNERFAIRLDEAPNEKLRHEFVVGIGCETEKSDLVSLSLLDGLYQELISEVGSLVQLPSLDVLIRTDLAPVDDVRKRVEILRKRRKEFMYIIPPGRPLRRIFFDKNDNLVLELDDYPRGFDALANYNLFYNGVPRTQLRNINPTLYTQLKRKGLINHTPAKPYQPRRDYGGDPLAYYREHYPGVTRGELAKKDPLFYNVLRYHRLLNNIPKVRRDYGGDPLAYYREHYPGVTRGQLCRVDKGLYLFLEGHNLLDQIPLNTSRGNYGKDPLVYYREHYPGVTRGQLQRLDHNYYAYLVRHGLIKEIPTKRKLEIQNAIDSLVAGDVGSFADFVIDKDFLSF